MASCLWCGTPIVVIDKEWRHEDTYNIYCPERIATPAPTCPVCHQGWTTSQPAGPMPCNDAWHSNQHAVRHADTTC